MSCGARTGLELARGGALDAGGEPESGGTGGQTAGGAGGSASDGASTGGAPTGGASGGDGGSPQTAPFCPLDFGAAEAVSLWAGSSELFVVAEDNRQLALWSKPYAGGEWLLLWRQDILARSAPTLTGFPDGGPLVLYGGEPCGVQFFYGDRVTCELSGTPTYDLHVVSSTEAYAATAQGILHFDGYTWTAAAPLPDAGVFQFTKSVWADANRLLVLTAWGDSALIYAARNGTMALRGELSVDNETFTNVEANSESEWLLTEDGELYVRWEGTSQWYLSTFFSGECSDFEEVWLHGPARYVRNRHSVTLLNDVENLRLVDLPCDSSATIASAVTSPEGDLYVALLDEALSACSGVVITKGHGATVSSF